jgi:hypothetical protein
MNEFITPILPSMIPMRDINQISDRDRLFYELGHKINSENPYYENNWIREGRFKEIQNIKEFLEGDKLLNDVKYLEHHNFMLIKSKNRKFMNYEIFAKELFKQHLEIFESYFVDKAKACTLITINNTINVIKLTDPNNDTGLIGFWNNVRLIIENQNWKYSELYNK